MMGELATVLPWEETYEQYVELVKRTYALDEIYTLHSGVAAARRTAGAIMPGSIVLMEGALPVEHELVKDGKLGYLDDRVASVGLELITKGQQSSEYQCSKRELLNYLANIMSDDRDEDRLWYATVVSLLIQKDCALFTADFDNRIQQLDADEADKFKARLSSRGEFDFTRLANESIGKLIRRATSAQTGFFEAQHTREWAAVINGTWVLARLFEIAPWGVHSMAKSRADSTKYQAYYVWGAAHSNSLHERLQNNKYCTRPNVIVDEKVEALYKLPLDNETDVNQEAKNRAFANVLRIAVYLSGAVKRVPEFRSRLANDITELQMSEEDVVHSFVLSLQLTRAVLDSSLHKPFFLSLRNRRHWRAKLNGDIQNLRTLLSDIGLNPDIYMEAPFTDSVQRKSRTGDITTNCSYPGVLISR